jgi:nickel/cobalt transporter (NicO) family protein
MKFLPCSLLLCACSFVLAAHPMGNFSINHYSGIELRPGALEFTYILDFAEIPTSELFNEWGITAASGDLQEDAARQAKIWARGLAVSEDGKPILFAWKTVHAGTLDGAGGLPVLRVAMTAVLPVQRRGELSFADGNFLNRTGWKEVVIRHAGTVAVDHATQSDHDLSKGLTVYPAELTVTPPQDLSASVTWHLIDTPVAAVENAKAASAPTPAIPAAVNVPDSPKMQTSAPPATSFAGQQPETAGTLKRGDYLSRMLQERHFGFTAIAIGLLAAFGLGAVHALSPGHGKTIVAAYLVGSRGTLKHAGILGLTVTFTHVISVFLLGIGVLFFQKYVIPEKIVPVLGAISGLSIVVIGGYLLYQRAMALLAVPHDHKHEHDHKHAHSHPHQHEHSHSHLHQHEHSHQHAGVPEHVHSEQVHSEHVHSHEHAHSHDHAASASHTHQPHSHTHTHGPAFAHTHTHDGHTHTHAVPENITMGSLLGLGISGGLVPCPSALVLLLSAISLGQVAIGLALLGAFSAGLAVVLMAIGGLVLYGKNLLPKTSLMASHPMLRLVPIFSSVVVIVVGLLMTLTAVGAIQPVKLLM